MLTQADAKAAAVRQPARARTTRRGTTGTATRPAAELESDQHVRTALEERLGELRGEYDEIMVEAAELTSDGLVPVAGDDVADIGTKTLAREQEFALAKAIRERIFQVERALERLDEGGYGRCEACADPIPPARLAAFPSATLCVSCKQRQER